MQTGRNLVIGLGVLLLLTCVTREALAAAPYSWGSNAFRLEKKTWPESSLVNDTTFVDSLTAELLPLLLAPPERRELEGWLQRRSHWTQRFGDSEQLLRYAEHIHQKFLKDGDLSRASYTRNAMGRILAYNAEYPRAIEAQQEAFTLAQQSGDSVMIGWSLINLGSVYGQTENLATAKDYFRRSERVGQDIDNSAIIAMGKLYTGAMFGKSGVADSALHLMTESYRIAKKNDFSSIEGIATLNIAMSHLLEERYDQAIRLLEDSVDVEKLADDQIETFVYLDLYEAYLGKEEYATAGRFLEQACAIADSTGFAVGSLHCHHFRSILAEKEGRFAEALQHYQEYHELQILQTGRRTQEQVQALQTRMRLRDKDYQIQALNEANRVREESYRRRRNLLYVGLGIAIFSLLGLYLGMRVHHRAKMAEHRRSVAETKLQVLQAQMNPHFIYNAMSGIQNYILKSEKIEAYNYLGKFAALLRRIANYSVDVYIELEEEVKLIRNYLELEKLRFREAFTYEMCVDEEAKNANLNVPSMMIQPIVENAMIHGFAGLERQGHLEVKIETRTDGVMCTVTDNGRGRAAAEAIKSRQVRPEHLSIASVNVEQRLAFLRSVGYPNAKVKTEDMYDENGPSGTRVSIYLPFVDQAKID